MLIASRAFTCIFLVFSLNRQATAQSAQPRSSVTPLTALTTSACSAAYTGAEDVVSYLPVIQSRINQLSAAKLDSFRQYDQACFRSLDQTSYPPTRPFVERIVGVLGQIDQSRYIPICTALRTGARVATTPAHCWCDYEKSPLRSDLIMRLMSDPAINIRVIGPTATSGKPNCSSLSDFEDAVSLALEGPTPTYSARETDFSGSLASGMKIAIIGFDAFRYLENSPDLSGKWISSLVFSPTSGSRKFASEWITPQPTNLQFSSCLYYAAPTYPGMSGGLILGYEPDNGGRLFVAGMHIRAGRSNSETVGCGNHQGVQGEVLNEGLTWSTVKAIIARP